MQIKLKNKSTNEVLEFGGVRDAYALNVVNLGATQGQHNTTKFINLNGSHINNTSLQERDISITGWVFARNAAQMKERKDFLNGFFNPRQDIAIYQEDYELTVRPDSSIRYSIDKYENREILCAWSIQGTAHVPLWGLIRKEVLFDDKVIKVPLFPLTIPENKGIAFGYIPARSVRNPINDGDVDVGFILTITAEEGQVLNPRITNNKTGQFIELMLSMNQGDKVVISTISGDKYVRHTRSGTTIDIFRTVTKQSTMSMSLGTGQNDFTVSAAENAVNMVNSIVFSPLWLEVQS